MNQEEPNLEQNGEFDFDPYFETLICRYNIIKECYENFRQSQINKLMEMLELPSNVKKRQEVIFEGLDKNQKNYPEYFLLNYQIQKYQQEVISHMQSFQAFNPDPESKGYFSELKETLIQRFSSEDQNKQINHCLPISLQDNFSNYSQLSSQFADLFINIHTKQSFEEDQYNLIVEEYQQTEKYQNMDDAIQDIKIKMRLPTHHVDPEEIMVSLIGQANYFGVFFGNLNPKNIFCQKIKGQKIFTPNVVIGIPNVYNSKQAQFLDDDIKPQIFNYKIQGMIVENKAETQYVSCTKTLPDINSMIKIIYYVIQLYQKQDVIFFDEDDPTTRENFSHDQRRGTGKLQQLAELLTRKQQQKQILQIDHINLIILQILENNKKKSSKVQICSKHNEHDQLENSVNAKFCQSCLKELEQSLLEQVKGQYDKIINKHVIKLQQLVSTKSYCFIQLKKKLMHFLKQLRNLELKKTI